MATLLACMAILLPSTDKIHGDLVIADRGYLNAFDRSGPFVPLAFDNEAARRDVMGYDCSCVELTGRWERGTFVVWSVRFIEKRPTPEVTCERPWEVSVNDPK